MKGLLFSIVLLCAFGISKISAQTTRTAGTYIDLNNAITASADNDIINITNNIVIDAEIAISKTLTINGNGYKITVPTPGLDEAGKFNTTPSTFRVFNLSASKITTINNLKISGGNTGTAGGAIFVGSGHTLRINNSTVSNSRSVSAGGIQNHGTVYMSNCEVIRNAAGYGGGFVNAYRIFIENSTFSENRSLNASGGGGAGENNSSLYINNSTFSNNKSTEIGGAINNYGGTIYITNSSLTGNVAYGGFTGGSIGNNSGTVYAVNCLFAYNYRRTSGSTTNPTTYTLDDVMPYSSGANVHLYYCIYQADLTSSGIDYNSANNGNVRYSGNASGSDNSIFSGGSYTRITDGTGIEIGDVTTGKVFQPFLFENANGIAPTLKTGSFTLQTANRGTMVGFTSNNGSPIIGYYNRLASTPAWVNLLSSPASSYTVTTDQIGTVRADPSAIGAIDGGINNTAGVIDNLYMLKVNYAADGSVTGGTVYGDVYPSGTSVTLTAIPNASKQFTGWTYVTGGSGTASTANPYTVVMDRDITLVPTFANVTGGNYSITYAGNGNTSGSAPATGNYSAQSTIATKGSLTRSGYIFDGWNTSPNGSGTNYLAGASYAAGTNLVLYAKWKDNFWRGGTSIDFSNIGNWGAGVIPGVEDDIVFAEDAVRDLTLNQNSQVGNVQFSGAPYKLVLGNYNLTATGVSNYSSTKYIQSNGTGKFGISIGNGIETLFPIGRSAYNPVSIKNNTGSTDVFSVQVLDELYMNGSSGTASTEGRVRRIWDISKATANSGAGIDLTFNWNAGETVSLTTPALFHYSSGWSKQTSGTTSYTSTSLQYTGYTGTFSPFGIAETNATLPVTWLNFKVQKHAENVLLTWATATETNNKDFVVEHSVNSIDWENIAVIKGSANSITEKNYQYLHTNPADGNNYYRIRQRDLDGKSSFSSVQSIKLESANTLSIYPNPVVNGNINVTIKKAGILKVYTNNGQLVLQRKLAAAGKHDINLQSLSKGIYRLSFEKQIVSIVLQ